MFRIRRVYDDVTPLNRAVIGQVQEILRTQFPGVSKKDIAKRTAELVNDKVYLQLNYVFWFPERPSESAFDIYSGQLDGIIWRVTLDYNAESIVYDSVHSCGCYHKFYATSKLKFNDDIAALEPEPPFIAQAIPNLEKGQRLIIRIDSKRHYIYRVYKVEMKKTAEINYSLKNYNELRSLTGELNSRSLFDEEGLVPESRRTERWILWPMGVPSAGAMRQWGNHAIAFVGRRYFDDPYLIDKYFVEQTSMKTEKNDYR